MRLDKINNDCLRIIKSSMANNTVVKCSNLASRSSFPKYITAIRNATGNNFTLVDQCQAEVCNALWGSGNPDISGIGVSQCYFFRSRLRLADGFDR